MTTDRLGEYIARAKEQSPIEAKIVHKIWAALRDAGNPIVSVYDGEETTKATTRTEVDRLVFNLDECYLNTKSGGWVRIVMGNEWDCLIDYTVSLEAALQGVNDYIDKYN